MTDGGRDHTDERAGSDGRTSGRRAVLAAIATGTATALSGCGWLLGRTGPRQTTVPRTTRTPEPPETLTRPPRRDPPWAEPPGLVTVEPPATTPPPDGRIYYVATDGDDGNPGTAEEPLATLGAALRRVAPGEAVRIRGGTYRVEGWVGPGELDGTASAPIRIGGVPGERPVFDFSDAETGQFVVDECSHLLLHDVVVERAPSRGLFVTGGSHDVVVRDVAVRNCGGDPDASGIGILLLDTTDCTVSRCVSRGNYDAPTGGEHADGIGAENSPDALIEGCVVYDNSDDGIDLWNGTEVTVRNCVAYANGWGPNGTKTGDGNGFRLGGGDRPSGDNRVERCIAFNNRVQGFDDNGATRPITLYNCTAWNNPTNFRLGCEQDGTTNGCPRHRLQNNISARGEVKIHASARGGTNSWSLDFDDPGFASTSPAREAFLSLTADSPAVDAGVDVGLPFLGDAPDLGAIEYRPTE